MSKVLITKSLLSDIADAIREKLGSSDTYTPVEMPDAIDSIDGGIVQVSSAELLDTYLQTKPINSAYEYTGTTTDTYINGRVYRVTNS